MSAPTLSFTIKFNLAVTPKVFTFVDTTDYAGAGITLTNVNGCFDSITSPSGVLIYENSDFSNGGCDIRVSVSTTNQLPILLPLGADGMPELGTYTIVYKVKDITGAPVYYTTTKVVTNAYIRPLVCIDQTVDCQTPLFTSKDITVYTVNSIIPTIVETHTLTFPVGSGLPVKTSSGLVISVGKGKFANGTQTTQISSVLTYTFTDGLIIYDIVTGLKNAQVDCQDICNIYCCLWEQYNTMINFRGSNDVRYEEERDKFSQVVSIKEMANMALACNQSADVSGYLTEIQKITNCNNKCKCSDSTPSLVYGLGNCGCDDGSGTNAVSADSVISFNVPTLSTGLTVTGCSITIPVGGAGKYLVHAEADFLAGNNPADITYRLIKNGTVLTTDRKAIVGANLQAKLVAPMLPFDLNDGDVIAIQVDSGAGGAIKGRSITAF